MCGGDEDCAVGVPSLANEEPLMIVKARIDIMWEVVREDCGNSRGSVVWKGKAPLCRGGCGSIHEGALGAENGDVSGDRGRGVHQGSEVFATGRGNKDVVGVNGDVLVKRGKKGSVENFLSYLGGSGRHCW